MSETTDPVEIGVVVFEPVESAGDIAEFAMPKPADVLHIQLGDEPSPLALEAIAWRRLIKFAPGIGGALVRGWSLVPVGLPP